MAKTHARTVPLWAGVLLAVAAGLQVLWSFPAVSLPPLAVTGVATLLIALRGRRIPGAILVGAAYGLSLYLPLVSWTSTYLGPVPWLALAVLEAAITAVMLLLVSLLYRWWPARLGSAIFTSLARAVTVAALWLAGEYVVGTWPYGGFPWARLGMTQAESPLAQLSSWVGVSGVSFVLVFAAAALVEALAAPRKLRWVGPVAASLVIVVATVVPQYQTTDAGSFRIGAVQGNGPAGYFDDREPYSVIDAQIAATKPLYEQAMDLLVWPEGGSEYDPFQDAGTAARLTTVANRVDAPVLGNSAVQHGERYFNTSMLWMPDGTSSQETAKWHPVPFGEYVPDRALYAAIVPELVGLIAREFSPGTALAPAITVGDTVVGTAICFDVIYDDVINAALHAGAEVLVMQTNNADFRGTVENVQQLAMARMRAIETGRTVVNISTVGASQIIRPDGTTLAALNADEAGAMLETIELRSGLTSGVVLGPGIQQFLLWGGLLVLVLSGLGHRRRG